MLPTVSHKSVPQAVIEFDKLFDAIDGNDLKKFYTKETALGFHYLVYCAFLLAGHAIGRIQDFHVPLKGKRPKNDPDGLWEKAVEDFKLRIEAAVFPMKLLNYVLISSVFKVHIGVWTKDGEFLHELLPKWSQKKDNIMFGKTEDILASSKMGPTEKTKTEAGGASEAPAESPTEGGGENDDASKGPTEDGKYDDDEDADDEPSEVSKSIC